MESDPPIRAALSCRLIDRFKERVKTRCALCSFGTLRTLSTIWTHGADRALWTIESDLSGRTYRTCGTLFSYGTWRALLSYRACGALLSCGARRPDLSRKTLGTFWTDGASGSLFSSRARGSFGTRGAVTE